MRPFGPNAPWNIPVANIPAGENFSTLLWNDSFTDRPNRNFNFNSGEYTYPVYEVQVDTPNYPVVDTNGWGNLGGTNIPFDPAWTPAPGSDAQMIILDPATGREWDLWQVTFDGSTVTISNGNLVDGNYFTKEDGFSPSRGCGIQYLAMLVRPWEVEAGVIEHALSMPIQNTSGSRYFAPATKIEWPGLRLDGIPEGARFSLNISEAQIDAHLATLPIDVPTLTKSSIRTLLVALKDYGWFITDTAGSCHWQLEAMTTASAEWAALGMVDTVYSDGMTYPRDAIDGLITEANIVSHVASNEYPAVGGGESPAPTPTPVRGSGMKVFLAFSVDEGFQSLADAGFTGTINDKQYAYLKSLGGTGGLGDMLGQGLEASSFSFSADFTSLADLSLFTFSRNSSASNVNSSGSIASVAINTPRLGYHTWGGSSWDNGGLLLEEADTNIISGSENFNTAPWTKSSGTTITVDQAVAPDGTTTADLLIIGAGKNPTLNDGAGSVFLNGIAVSNATEYVFSVYAKAKEVSTLLIRNADQLKVVYDLTTGTITSGGGVADFLGFIEDAGNGWYKCGATFTTTATTHVINIKPGVIGDGTSGLYIWGAEMKSTKGSYIKTSGAAATRASDVISVDLDAGTYDVRVVTSTGTVDTTGVVHAGGAYWPASATGLVSSILIVEEGNLP